MASEEKVTLYLKDLMTENEYKRMLERATQEAIEQLNIDPVRIRYNSLEDGDPEIVITVVINY